MIYNYMRGEVEKGGGEINSYCPVCQPSGEDKDKHLYYKIGGEKILAHCQHGCSFDDIIKFFPKSGGGKSGNRVLLREHIYYNIDGSIFGKKCYFMIDGKKSPIWYRYENGEYKSGLNGGKAGLYNIGELTNADENKTVWVVEGEKDCDNMKKRGFLAVSPPSGAGYWKADFNKYFRNRNVVIIPDNDEVGRKHLEKVAKNLSKTARTVRLIDLTDIVPELKKGGDISDVFEELPNAEEELVKLMSETESEKTRSAGVCYLTDFEGKPLKTFDNFGIMLNYFEISKVRYNSFAGVEFEGKMPEFSSTNAEEVSLTYLYSLSRETNINFSKQEIGDYVLMHADKHCYNPVKEWLMSLEPPAEYKFRAAKKYFECLEFDKDEESDRSFYFLLFAKWLVQCVALQFNDFKKPFGADGALGLQSEREGIGKTSFFRNLCFDSKLFKDGMNLDPANKDDIITATGFWICELGEVESTVKKDMARLKAFVTAESDVYRSPYARGNTKKPRQTSYCFTCNSDKFLREGDNRRFWTIPITGVKKEIKETDISEIWSEAYMKYKSDPNWFRLTPEEIKRLAGNNREKFSIMSNEEQVLRDKLNFDAPEHRWKYVTSTGLSEKLFGDARNACAIGKAMSQKMGFNKKKQDLKEGEVKHSRVSRGKTEYFCPPLVGELP